MVKEQIKNKCVCCSLKIRESFNNVRHEAEITRQENKKDKNKPFFFLSLSEWNGFIIINYKFTLEYQRS